ncbi:MAG: DNA-processing protein DprA [Bacteroidales bacterium]
MNRNDLLYKIALASIYGVGSKIAQNLVAYAGGVREVFELNKKELANIPGVGTVIANRISDKKHLSEAEKQLFFVEKYKISSLFFTDADFPYRLKQCPDFPVILYGKGNMDLHKKRIVSIVGTRMITEYGKNICKSIIEQIRSFDEDILVVSGLAYGVDINIHRACLKHNLQTVGVLGHGLNTIYPKTHRREAEQMLQNGGLVTDFTNSDTFDRKNFVRRNRIIAGLADATIVVESAESGGAMISAEIAQSYDRDVFAFPGDVSNKFSKGCHKLIKTNVAALCENFADVVAAMCWDEDAKQKLVQTELFPNLSQEEDAIIIKLRNKKYFIDELAADMEMPVSKLSPLLLSLELKGLIKSLPGNLYAINTTT